MARLTAATSAAAALSNGRHSSRSARAVASGTSSPAKSLIAVARLSRDCHSTADRYGRKKVLFAIGVLYFVGALGSAFVSNLALFQIFRFLGGIGVGVSSVVAPIYTAEIAPPALRGRLVGL